MKCKVTNYLVLTLALSTVLMSVVIVNAKKPLYCEKTMDMNLLGGEIFAEGPISGDINGWFIVKHLDPLNERHTGQVTHYGQRWEIWDSSDKITKYMGGTLEVHSNNKKLEWVGQGVVEDAYVQYADFVGCIWHAQGIIDLVNFQIVDDYFIMNGPR